MKITKRGSMYRAQPMIAGKRYSVTGRTKGEVKDKIAALRLKAGEPESSDMTVKEAWDLFMEKVVKPEARPQTVMVYNNDWKNHISPALGTRKVAEITRDDLERYYDAVWGINPKTGKEYSRTTILDARARLGRFFRWLTRRGILSSNPHENILTPRGVKSKKVEAYSRKDSSLIAAYTKITPGLEICYIMLMTGMRFGEVAALAWEDVDLAEQKIKIHRTLIKVRGGSKIQETTKTESSMRTIAISDTLARWLKGRPERRGFVCHNADGSFISENGQLLRWQKACDFLNIERKTMHALRHTWATRALEAGVDVKTVSQMLGHKSVSTTMDIYQDSLPDHQREAAQKVEKLF